jgi:hypothetical protein
MKSKLTAIVICCCSLFSVSTFSVSTTLASGIPNPLLPGWAAFHQSTLRDDITFLSKDTLQGRLSLTPGDNQAVQWIAEQFKKAGLKPAAQASYLQSVPLIEYFPDQKKSYIALERAGKLIRWKKPDVYTQFPENINLTGEVVFAGYGITAPELHYDDYQHIDAHGKIVLVFEHEPQETNSASVFNGIANTPYATTRLKLLNAQQHGGIAVLIAPEPNRKHPSNQERYLRIGGSINLKMPSQVLASDEIQIPSVVISDAVAKQIAGDQISLSQLQTAIDRDFKPQSILLPDTKITISDRNKSRRTGTTYNVVGLLEGSDPTLKHETIIISAHHDHDGSSGQRIWRGADDNASGTVGVVALARAMVANANSHAGMKPKRSILFVVFAAEERGLLGAFYMTANPLRPLDTTRAVINFDMIGRNEAPTKQTDGLIDIPRDTANRLNLIGAHYSPDYAKTVAQQNHFVGLVLDHRFDDDSALNIFFRSDQFPFILHHIPAFWWFTGFHQDYHHTTDTADKINYAKMEKILWLSYLSAFSFANEQVPPKFIENPGG